MILRVHTDRQSHPFSQNFIQWAEHYFFTNLELLREAMSSSVFRFWFLFLADVSGIQQASTS